MKAKTALIAAALLVAATARAEFYTGNELHRDINSDVTVARSHALGYIVGVHDATTGAHCAPEGMTAGQLRDMVKIWLRENPAERHRSGDIIVLYVLKTTFPCAKKQATPGV